MTCENNCQALLDKKRLDFVKLCVLFVAVTWFTSFHTCQCFYVFYNCFADRNGLSRTSPVYYFCVSFLLNYFFRVRSATKWAFRAAPLELFQAFRLRRAARNRWCLSRRRLTRELTSISLSGCWVTSSTRARWRAWKTSSSTYWRERRPGFLTRYECDGQCCGARAGQSRAWVGLTVLSGSSWDDKNKFLTLFSSFVTTSSNID